MINPASPIRYRTTRDIVIPKGNIVVFVSRMKQDVARLALAIVSAGPDVHYEWSMNFDDALAAKWIEKVSD
jgi:hypothetical protein